MKKTIYTLLAAALIASGLVGCASYTERAAAADKRIAETNKKIDKARDAQIQKASEFVVATTAALEYVEEDSAAVKASRQLNDLAASTLANAGYEVPTARELELQALVVKLTSANAELQAEGQKSLSKEVKKVAAIQKEFADYKVQREKDFIKKGEELTAAAARADDFEGSWFGGKVRRLMTWGGILSTFGIAGVIALCVFVPAAIPLVLAVVTRLVSFIVAILPKAAKFFGVVGKKSYDVVVSGIQDGKEQLKKSIEEAKARGETEKAQALIDARETIKERLDYAHDSPATKAAVEVSLADQGFKPATA